MAVESWGLESLMWNHGCGIMAVESLMWNHGCGILAVESWPWNPGCGIVGVGTWLWNPGCDILAVASWLWNPGCGILAVEMGASGSIWEHLGDIWETSGEASGRHPGGIWEASGASGASWRPERRLGGKMCQNNCVLQCLSLRPGIWCRRHELDLHVDGKFTAT